MELDLTPFIVFVVGVAVGALQPLVNRLIDKVFLYFGRVGFGDYELDDIAARLVKAAEQMYKANDGEAKKAQVLQWFEAELARRGVKIDLSLVEAAIEAAVYNMNHREQ